jgi:hypothetical protein
VFHAIWHIKKRLFGPGGVANPRDTTRYRCGLRLARSKNPAFLFVPASVKHCTRNGPVKFEPIALSLLKGFDKLSLNGS